MTTPPISAAAEPYLFKQFIRRAWYVAAWDHDISADGMLARTLLGEPVVFYRNQSGQVVALEDRCCHRAAPLSRGRKEGDCVRCLYHGMKFDSQGVCVDSPGQSVIPEKARVKSYPVVERDRFVWIWMGDPSEANDQEILDFFWHNSPDWRMKPGYIHYQANYQLIVDNLLDFSHLSYVHPTTLGTQANADTQAQVERYDAGLKITRWYLNSEMSPNHKRVSSYQGPVDRWQIYQWHAPAFMRMDAGSAPAGSGAPEGRLDPRALQFRHTSVQTPETLGTSHYFFCQARNFALDNEAMTDAIFDDVVTAFDEDRQMIEAQQRVLDHTPAFTPFATAHDKGLIQARMLIREALRRG